MTDLSPEIAPDVAAACTQNLAETVEALSRTLETPVEATVGEPGVYAAAEPPEGWDGAGLVVLMTAGGVAAAAVLPASSTLVPDWVAAPDATGESRLATLAQELSMLVLPETVLAEEFQAGWADGIGAALERGGLAAGAGLVPVSLTAGDRSGTLSILAPIPSPGSVAIGPTPAGGAAPQQHEQPTPAPANHDPNPGPAEPPAEARQPSAAPARRRPTDLQELPPLSRSLLKVAVPVTVCLASKEQSVHEIVELGPGAIISFDKSCDEPVALTVGDRTIGLGEVVKVGEHFGIRVDTMVLPEEGFRVIRRRSS